MAGKIAKRFIENSALASAILLIAVVAARAEPKVSDLQYLKAARCRGLAASRGLGRIDTTAVDAFLRRQAADREAAVQWGAEIRLQRVERAADKASAVKAAKLMAERANTCATWLSGGPAMDEN